MITEETKTPRLIKIGAVLLSLLVFTVGYWHTHLGLKNQHFFSSEYGSLFIAAIPLLLLLLSYFFIINGKKNVLAIAFVVYLICAFTFIICNLNYFYPYDFKEDLVREDAGALKDTLQSYATRATGMTGLKSEAINDYLNLEQLKDQIHSEIADQHGYKDIARAKVADFNRITAKYGVKEVNPSLANVTNFNEQARIVDEYLVGAMKNFIEKTLKNGDNIKDVKTKIIAENRLFALQEKYTPVLESIQRDTTKINISNDKKNIENNPKNIAIINAIISELNSVTKPVNEINKGKEPFVALDASITKLGSVGHTLPSIVQHIKTGTKEQKVGTWKNIMICLLIDLLVPLAIYFFLREKSEIIPGGYDGAFNIPWWKRIFGSGIDY
jgi:hypothetical protein